MCSLLTPPHLLFLDHALADHLIHRRLDKASGNPFAIAIALTIVWDEWLIVENVSLELLHLLKQLAMLRGGLLCVERVSQPLYFLQCPKDITMPEIPLDTFYGHTPLGVTTKQICSPAVVVCHLLATNNPGIDEIAFQLFRNRLIRRAKQRKECLSSVLLYYRIFVVLEK